MFNRSRQLCDAFSHNSDLRLTSRLRDHAGRASPNVFRVVSMITSPSALRKYLIRRQGLSDINLTHHDQLAAIDPLHNAMDHRADSVDLATPERLVAVLYHACIIKCAR